MKTRLSICIPTYNREPFLRELLNSIIEQVNPSDVQIAISDNASSDKTMELVDEFKNIYPNIVYFRWPQNMGADRNYLKTVEIANGDYCWLMGSDDVVPLDSIEQVLSLIDGADVVLFGRTEAQFNLKKIRERCWLDSSESDQDFDFSKTGELLRYFKACRSLGGVFSYLSSIVVRREKWCAVDVDGSFIGTAYVHAYVLLNILRDGGVLRYSKLPLVVSRGGNDSFLTNWARRGELDFDGYRKLSYLFSSDTLVRSAFFGIMRHEYSIFHVMKLTSKLSFVRRQWEDWLSYMKSGIEYYGFPKWLPIISLLCLPILKPIYLVKIFIDSRRRG